MIDIREFVKKFDGKPNIVKLYVLEEYVKKNKIKKGDRLRIVEKTFGNVQCFIDITYESPEQLWELYDNWYNRYLDKEALFKAILWHFISENKGLKIFLEEFSSWIKNIDLQNVHGTVVLFNFEVESVEVDGDYIELQISHPKFDYYLRITKDDVFVHRILFNDYVKLDRLKFLLLEKLLEIVEENGDYFVYNRLPLLYKDTKLYEVKGIFWGKKWLSKTVDELGLYVRCGETQNAIWLRPAEVEDILSFMGD